METPAAKTAKTISTKIIVEIGRTGGARVRSAGEAAGRQGGRSIERPTAANVTSAECACVAGETSDMAATEAARVSSAKTAAVSSTAALGAERDRENEREYRDGPQTPHMG